MAIVGAGVAGLATARELMRAGMSCTVFERGESPGGVWADGYLNFGVQVQKELYEFPDWPLPTETSDFTPGNELRDYLDGFADRFGITPAIKLRTRVVRVEDIFIPQETTLLGSIGAGLQVKSSVPHSYLAMNPQESACQVAVGHRIVRANRLKGRSPTVVFCSGFRSDMAGTKAMMLDAWCRERDQGFLRFDYSGHGESDGTFEEGTIGRWLDDTLEVIDRLTVGPLLLVGSSMGGWITLLAALARPDRVAGLVGIASAPDFTEELLWRNLTREQQDTLEKDGRIELPSDYTDDPHVITQGLVTEGRNHLLLPNPIQLQCPVRLLHSLDDPDVPWEISLRAMQQIDHSDVRLSLLKDAGHRISRPQDLQQILVTVEGLLGELDGNT